MLPHLARTSPVASLSFLASYALDGTASVLHDIRQRQSKQRGPSLLVCLVLEFLVSSQICHWLDYYQAAVSLSAMVLAFMDSDSS